MLGTSAMSTSCLPLLSNGVHGPLLGQTMEMRGVNILNMFVIYMSIFSILFFYLIIVKAPNSFLASKVLEKSDWMSYDFIYLLNCLPTSTRKGILPTYFIGPVFRCSVYKYVTFFCKLKPLTLVNCIGVSLRAWVIITHSLFKTCWKIWFSS